MTKVVTANCGLFLFFDPLIPQTHPQSVFAAARISPAQLCGNPGSPLHCAVAHLTTKDSMKRGAFVVLGTAAMLHYGAVPLAARREDEKPRAPIEIIE